MLLLLLLLAAILCAAAWAWPWLRMTWMARRLRGPTVWTLLGCAMKLLRDPEEALHFIGRLFAKHGPVVGVQLGPVLVVLIGDPADAQVVLAGSVTVGRGRLARYAFHGFIDVSLFTSEGETARARRRLVAPAFHAAQLASYVDVFARNADEMCARFAKMADGRTVDILEKMTDHSLLNVCQTVIGTRLDYDSEKWVRVRKEITEGYKLLSRRLTNLRLLFDWKTQSQAIKTFTEFFHDAVTKHHQTKSNSSDDTEDRHAKARSFLDIFADTSSTAFTEPEFHEEFKGLISAGMVTSASTMAYTLLLLAIHPDHQQLVLEEQRDIFDDSLRAATVDEMSRMTTLEAVVKEAMRLFPVAPFVPRHVPVDVVLPGGAFLPAGATAIVSAYHMHRDASNFMEPARFWPERWLPENDVKRHPCAYLPFGAGTRKCIGYKYAWLMMKGTLSRVLREFRVGCRYTMGDLQRIEPGITITSIVGYDVQLHTR